MRTAIVPVPKVEQQRVAVPAAYLQRQCLGVKLSDAVDGAQFEDTAARLWVCVQDLNHQLDEIAALK